MVSPIGSPGTESHRRASQVLKYIVKKALLDVEVVRADEESSPDSITTQVIRRIIESDLIVADLTDHNPNVFYELAVAHGYNKPVIHLIENGQTVPFDVVDQRVIKYDLSDPESVDVAIKSLIQSRSWLEQNPGQARNPLTAYGQFAAIRSNPDEGGEAVAEALERFSGRLASLERSVASKEAQNFQFSEGARPPARTVSPKEITQLLRAIDDSDDPSEQALLRERLEIVTGRSYRSWRLSQDRRKSAEQADGASPTMRVP